MCNIHIYLDWFCLSLCYELPNTCCSSFILWEFLRYLYSSCCLSYHNLWYYTLNNNVDEKFIFFNSLITICHPHDVCRLNNCVCISKNNERFIFCTTPFSTIINLYLWLLTWLCECDYQMYYLNILYTYIASKLYQVPKTKLPEMFNLQVLKINCWDLKQNTIIVLFLACISWRCRKILNT